MNLSTICVSIIKANGPEEDISKPDIIEVAASWDAVKTAMNNVMLEPVWLKDGSCLLVDEDGLSKNLLYNELASRLVGGAIVGPAAFVRKKLIKKVLG